MPVDINAAVISNARLSEDYNVLTLAAPAIGEQTQPGQFVMVKAALPADSLLRKIDATLSTRKSKNSARHPGARAPRTLFVRAASLVAPIETTLRACRFSLGG